MNICIYIKANHNTHIRIVSSSSAPVAYTRYTPTPYRFEVMWCTPRGGGDSGHRGDGDPLCGEHNTACNGSAENV